jgi:hypothetical protein
MAKGKNAAALFEVIRKDKRFERKTPGAPAGIAPPKASPTTVSPTTVAAITRLWRKPAQAAPASLAQSVADMRPRRDFFSRVQAACKDFFSHAVSRFAPARTWLARQSGIGIGAALALTVIAGILLARHLTHPHLSASDLAAEQQLRNGPTHPDVLAISEPAAPDEPAASSPELAADVMQATPAPAPAPAMVAAQSGARITNLQYVLVQSYLDEKTANDALHFLNQHGIPCTIEHGVKGWRKDFYQIIGLQGFPRASGSAYLGYRRQIDALSLLFSPNPRSYKHFAPQAIKW